MEFDNLLPPVSDLAEMWNVFTFHFASATGFTFVLGAGIWLLVSFIVFTRRGLEASSTFAVVTLPIIVQMGLFPEWMKLLSYVLAVGVAVRAYVRYTEGIQ